MTIMLCEKTDASHEWSTIKTSCSVLTVLGFFFSSRRRHTRSVSAFLLNRSSDLMEAKHWGLRKSRNATSLNSRFKSLDTLKVKIISVTFRRVIRTNHKKASKIWRHENIQLGGCQS